MGRCSPRRDLSRDRPRPAERVMGPGPPPETPAAAGSEAAEAARGPLLGEGRVEGKFCWP